MSYQSKGTYHLSELTDPKKLVPIDPNGKQLANLCDFACGIQAIADVKNMAALMAEICNISSNFFTDFLLAKEALFGESREEDDFIFISMSTFFIGLWRESQNFLKKLFCFIIAMFSGTNSL